MTDLAVLIGARVMAAGDPARVRQIVRSLLSNALAHGAEPVTVDIASNGYRAVVSVKDRGAGMAERP